jgi:RES domain-containing protein
MFLWRISNHRTLDGNGGLLASARWHTQGRAVVYLAESAVGAMVEVLVHLELGSGAMPPDYRLLKIEAPDDISVRTVTVADLPRTWAKDSVATRTIGDEWLASGGTALLRVPSAIVPETWNVLLNPAHADAKRLKLLWHRAYPWDERLLK